MSEFWGYLQVTGNERIGYLYMLKKPQKRPKMGILRVENGDSGNHFLVEKSQPDAIMRSKVGDFGVASMALWGC